MDRNAIEELFAYTGYAWDRIARVIDTLPAGQFSARIPGSGWPALRDCFEHWLAAYDGWINAEWGLALGTLLYPGQDNLQSWEQIRAYRVPLRQAFLDAFDCPDDVLYAKREYRLDDTPEQLSRADILTNLLLHERGHHGDLNTMFHQLGVRSFYVDYRYFISRPGDFVMDEEE